MSFRRIAFLIAKFLALASWAEALVSKDPKEFSIVTYNVENLFDVDGVALFDDYQQDSTDPFSYSRAKLLTKLEAIVRVLQTVNQGAGPEVILFQELETDFTPNSTVVDMEAFLNQYRAITVRAMLTTDWVPEFKGFPSAAWLVKALGDAGMDGYSVITVPSRHNDTGVVHTNAVFAKFPIRQYQVHPMYQARAIIEAELDIDGGSLVVYVNHWKSGASNPKREPIRIENAKVLRGLIDARLAQDPQADILVAGDLNSHYNQSILFPGLATGINDVLRSSGDESFEQSDLYNLWFELAPEARYSEVWRGRRGSLMHKLVSQGLYDDSGISYVDGSFGTLALPGINADAIGRPLRWHSVGATGGGASDHFPVVAKFTTAPFQKTDALSVGDDALDFEMPLSFAEYAGPLKLANGAFLNPLSDDDLAEHVGHLFTVEATILSIKPLRLEVDDTVWSAYYADHRFVEAGGLPDYLADHRGRVRLVVSLGFYRGSRQLIVEAILGNW